MLIQILTGLLLAAITSLAAYRFHSLTADGAIAATVLGTVVFGLGGWEWAVLLLTFFILSSAFTRAFRGRKIGAEEKYARGGARDAMQVFSNGGTAGLFVLLHAAYPAAGWPWIGYAGALAAVNADTWATELGVLSRDQPRLITSLRTQVDRGTSGGVSLTGTLASLAAALVIGLPAAWFAGQSQGWIAASVALAGLIGSLIDSLLGATLQAVYFCPRDQKETEKHPLHGCGTPTIHIRGLQWINNDAVNVACAITGAVMALALGARLLF
ncbi:MAG TPA: DUF92 domain-containing protein [Anaerolineales bacterium]|nr:DUF92 domain-containing protein [Anaerolineales bacterium]